MSFELFELLFPTTTRLLNQPAEGDTFYKISPDASVGVPTRCRRDRFLKRRLPPYA